MSEQQDAKIQELSDRNRTLVDKVSILERENRSLREKYRDALERLDEAEKGAVALMERYQSVVIEPGNVLMEPGEDDRHG